MYTCISVNVSGAQPQIVQAVMRINVPMELRAAPTGTFRISFGEHGSSRTRDRHVLQALFHVPAGRSKLCLIDAVRSPSDPHGGGKSISSASGDGNAIMLKYGPGEGNSISLG